jgi:alpha-galactosidase
VSGWLRQDAGARAPWRPGLKVLRQDYGTLRRGRSMLDTPLRVGDKRYAHGLGTHSVSEIVVRLPRPGRRFEASVGIDNNDDTGGKRGSVIFVVELAGKAVFRSGVRRGRDAPLAVGVDLEASREFVLRVLDAGDGPGWDQADWAEASVMLEDGRRIWLDEMELLARDAGLSTDIPFSFLYGGKSSAELLATWKRTLTQAPAKDGRQRHTVTYTDPATGLEVVCDLTLFAEYPAVEWVLHLRNGGAGDTPVLEDILPLDVRCGVPGDAKVVLHHAHGSTCAASDFLPIDQPVAPKAEIRLAPNGGRSSNGCLPFFNLAWPGGGVVAAIGWSGQWAMRLRRDEGGGLHLQAGQEKTHLKLHPGEGIRTPRILLVTWQGDDRLHGHNLLRRVLLEHYVPRLDGEVVVPPVTQNTWFVYNSGNDVTEDNQLEVIRAMAPLGVEAYWLDAGWFEGGWPSGVGSWVPKAKAFPRGLKPLGDPAHEKGMKFVVWFEPERVNPNSRIAKEHKQWVLRAGGGDGLFNLGDPAARKWLTDHLARCIADWGIDVYRNDFNIDPLGFWQAADGPDRQGICEIRYVEGLYAMWDELRRRHPRLVIDTCASGGRRIDLEMITRSLPLWRSDTQCCGREMPTQDQSQIAGLSLYVPLHSGGCWSFEPYAFRSVAMTGANICPDTRAEGFPVEQAKAAIAEAKALRPLYLGDYYPLLRIDADERHWCGWQFDRPELGEGFAVLFRRPRSPYAAADVALRGLDAAATYEVSFAQTYEVKDRRRMTGAELARLRVAIGSAPGSVLVRYRKAEKRP